MSLTTVRFASDEGDTQGFDLDLLDRHRERIRQQVLRKGELDSRTIAGGKGFLTMVDLPDGDYIAVSWVLENDEEALIVSVALGDIETPP
jgi:hypothetical protein